MDSARAPTIRQDEATPIINATLDGWRPLSRQHLWNARPHTGGAPPDRTANSDAQ
jgi:hypothetical protein